VNAARRTGLANAVDFEFPETPAWRAAKNILENSGIGELRHFAVHWNVETYAVKRGLDSWKLRSAEGGGALFSFASHVFYNLEWLAGPIQTVACQYREVQPGGEMFIAMTAELQSGAVGSISVSIDAIFGGGQRWEFYGGVGTLVLSNSTADYVDGFQVLYGTGLSGQMAEIPIRAGITSDADGRIAAVTPLAARFIEWSRGGPPSYPDLSAGLRVQRLLDAAHQAHATGRRIQCC
jgi:predicted dehydrogenase